MALSLVDLVHINYNVLITGSRRLIFGLILNEKLLGQYLLNVYTTKRHKLTLQGSINRVRQQKYRQSNREREQTQ